MDLEPVRADFNREATERTTGGKFAPGNRIGRGNGNHVKMSQFRKILLDAADPTRLIEAFKKLESLAVEGDLAALNLYLAYVVGKPTQAVELTGADGGPLGSDLIAVVMEALSNHPSARIDVAARLRAARDGGPRVWPEGDDR